MKDFPYTDLKHYLSVHGLLQAEGEVLESAKRSYLKLYRKAYRKAYAKTQMNLVLSKEELTFIKEEAQKYSLKPTQFILYLIRNSIKGTMHPPNLLIDIEIGLLKTIDGLAKCIGCSKDTRGKLIDLYQHVQSLLILFAV
jgi:hypothetical protein